jgi:hypothetical protein
MEAFLDILGKYGKPYLATVPTTVGMGRLLVVREARRPATHRTVEPSG